LGEAHRLGGASGVLVDDLREFPEDGFGAADRLFEVGEGADGVVDEFLDGSEGSGGDRRRDDLPHGRQFLAYPLGRFGGAVEGLRHAVLGDDRDTDDRICGHALYLRDLYRRGVAVEQGLDESGDGVRGDCRFVAADLYVQAGGGYGAGVAYAAGDEGELVGGEIVEAEVDGDRGRGP